MQRTQSLFDERKQEIEFYYLILEDIDISNGKINTSDNTRFERILKSNFLLMLYNLIEACITSGFIEIYEAIEANENTYEQLIEDLKKIWSDNKVASISENTANAGTYKKLIREILDDVLEEKPLEFNITDRPKFTKNILKNTGNLDARAIRGLLKAHNIGVTDEQEKHKIKLVKEKRNSLAHGEESFGDSARDLSVLDLKDYKNEVLGFIASVLCAMEDYYTNKRYLLS